MARKPPTKGGALRLKKVLLPFPEDLHHQMKVRAAERKITMREFIAEAIQQALEKGGEKKK